MSLVAYNALLLIGAIFSRKGSGTGLKPLCKKASR
jgi:hypothetical protein